jgi:hypothetical protein
LTENRVTLLPLKVQLKKRREVLWKRKGKGREVRKRD